MRAYRAVVCGCAWNQAALLCFDVLALVVLAREIVAEFGLAVEPELIRPGCMSVV